MISGWNFILPDRQDRGWIFLEPLLVRVGMLFPFDLLDF